MSKITLDKPQYDAALQELQRYFAEERDESIGMLQGRLLLDFILEQIGPHIYNQAVADMQKYVALRAEDMFGFMR